MTYIFSLWIQVLLICYLQTVQLLEEHLRHLELLLNWEKKEVKVLLTENQDHLHQANMLVEIALVDVPVFM